MSLLRFKSSQAPTLVRDRPRHGRRHALECQAAARAACEHAETARSATRRSEWHALRAVGRFLLGDFAAPRTHPGQEGGMNMLQSLRICMHSCIVARRTEHIFSAWRNGTLFPPLLLSPPSLSSPNESLFRPPSVSTSVMTRGRACSTEAGCASITSHKTRRRPRGRCLFGRWPGWPGHPPLPANLNPLPTAHHPCCMSSGGSERWGGCGGGCGVGCRFLPSSVPCLCWPSLCLATSCLPIQAANVDKLAQKGKTQERAAARLSAA